MFKYYRKEKTPYLVQALLELSLPVLDLHLQPRDLLLDLVQLLLGVLQLLLDGLHLTARDLLDFGVALPHLLGHLGKLILIQPLFSKSVRNPGHCL